MKGPLLLQVQDLWRAFGGVEALQEVGFQLGADEILGLIGPNGAGKTTLFNVISGLIKPDRGKILFRGQNLAGLPPHQITARGIARTFQNVRLFPEMTILENVMLGRHVKSRAGIFSALCKCPAERKEEKAIREFSLALLDKFGLASRAHEPAANLPFGQMRLLEILRALAAEPSLLLLDEPAAGLNTVETERLSRTILGLRDQGIALIVVEHDMRLVMETSDRVVVLNHGRKIAEGPPREVQNNPEVIVAYLGEGPAGPIKTGTAETGGPEKGPV